MNELFYNSKDSRDTIYAFYDLAVSPATFDIISFLVLAENERKKYDYQKMHVVIVPGPDNGFRPGNFENYNKDLPETKDHDYMGWRLRNILVPCCWSFPSCSGVTVCGSRSEVVSHVTDANHDIFPLDYNLDSPRGKYLLSNLIPEFTRAGSLAFVKSSKQAGAFIDQWIDTHVGKKKIVTITLRECSYELGRNSTLEAWAKFATSLNSETYYPVIIRDTEAALQPIPEPLKNLNLFPDVVWNLEIRIALYERAYLNMFVANGPGIFGAFSESIRFLMFKIITQNCAATSVQHLKSIGLEVGAQLPWLNQFQRWVWEDDEYEVIVREFESMAKKIEQQAIVDKAALASLPETGDADDKKKRSSQESFILGSGKSLLTLDKKEVAYINRADVSISINKYLLFYDLVGIIPKYHIQFDANDEPSQRVFLRTLDKIINDEKLHGVILVFGEKLGKYAKAQHLPNPIIVSSLHPLTGDGWNPELDKIGWSKSIDKNLFHFKGTLTSAMNFAHALRPLNRIKLVGTDMNSNEYFFQDEYEQDSSLHDWTYDLMKKSGKHSNIMEEVGGYKQDYCIPWVENHICKTGGEIYICNLEAHYAKVGLLPYSEICDNAPPRRDRAQQVASLPNYQSKLNQEIAIYEHNTEVHNLPEIHNVYARDFLVPHLTELTGRGDSLSWWVKEIDDFVVRADRTIFILSLACGNGDTEIGLLKRLAAPEKVQFIGVDVNPNMIERARAAAKSEGLKNVSFEIQDLNNPDLQGPIDVVLANHSLHHLVELERLFKQISERSSDDMIFLINDMIGRNGHVMWPNAQQVVKEIWRRLDQRFRLNNYSKKYDLQPFNRDCSLDGFEGIRAQDILPKLIQIFDIEMFMPFATIINRFVDRGYGPNFNADDAQDRKLILDILALDISLLKAKKLSPTQAFIKVQKKGTVKEPRFLFQTPEEALSSRHHTLNLAEYYNQVQAFLPHLSDPGAGAKMELEGNFPRVSVVIPVFNNLEYTHKCIKSILKNTRHPNYEVIIVDNGSTDGTADYLKSIQDEHFKFISHPDNLGFVGGCNSGAAHASGEFILFLNNDTEVKPSWMKAVVDLMKERPDCGAVGSKLIYADGVLQEAGGIIFSDGDGWNVGRGMDPRDPRFNYVRDVDYCSGAALTIRTHLWNEIGGFDQRYAPAYYEDTDLCFEVRKHGYKVFYHPLSEVIHYEGKTAGTDIDSGFKRFQAINRVKFMEKWNWELSNQCDHKPENVIQAAERGNRANILIADPLLPMWDRASGSLRLFQTIEILAAANYHVVFIARISNASDVRYIKRLIELGVEVYPQDVGALRDISDDPALDKMKPIDYELLFNEKQFQVAILSFWNIAAYYTPIIRRLSPKTQIVVDTVDVHFIRELREAALTGDSKALEESRMRKSLEIKTYKAADSLWVVTEEDLQELKKVGIKKPIHILPNIHKNVPFVKHYVDTKDLLFVGNFNHTPNCDAILYFCQEIYPAIKTSIPDLKLYIVGNNPPVNVFELAREDIIVTGFVEDISPYLFHARISVNPLRYGGGMKGKIGEALSWGLPVVTSTIGAEGMHLKDGVHCLIADEPADFTNAVVKAYQSETLWQTLADNGRQLVNDNWSPLATAKILKKVLEEPPVLNSPLVSIVILTWNALKYTRECVESIKKNTEYSYEIIFVDNASKDGTQAYLKELVQSESNYTLIQNPKNRGFSAGNNQGVEAARGKYILLLNNDVLVARGWLSAMVSALELDSHIGMVGPITNHISGRQMLKEVPYKETAGFEEFAGQVLKQNQKVVSARRRIAGFAILMEKALYSEVGGLDESFGSGNFEDDDLCLKVRQAGYAIMVHEGVFIHHYGSQTFKANKIDYTESLKTRSKLFEQKWSDVDYEELIELKNPLAETHPKQMASGMHDLELGDYNSAFDRLNTLVLEDPLNVEALLGLALAAKTTNKLELAIATVTRVLNLDPHNAPAFNLSGMISAEAGNIDGATKLFKLAFENDPEFVDAHRNYAEILLMSDHFQEGVQVLMDIISTHPEDIPSLLRLAELNLEADRIEDARELAKRVLSIDPEQIMAKSILMGGEE
ncbi:MAG: glycosyltransferase [Candidatus Marinimicrobia bacterium]|nr:glycosyltransferase [Candidatus Neomarinimicrobiota bacterium]